jgi:hypothetical protein
MMNFESSSACSRCAPKGAIASWVKVPPGQWSVGLVSEGKGECDPGPWQQWDVGGSMRHTEPPVAGMVRLLQSRLPLGHGSGDRVTSLRPRAQRPRSTLQAADAQQPADPQRCALRPDGSAATARDAGDPHVRFDERGEETGCVYNAAPLLHYTVNLSSSLIADVTPQIGPYNGNATPRRSPATPHGRSRTSPTAQIAAPIASRTTITAAGRTGPPAIHGTA